ncbi:xanthine dehydrogenase family protein molybdopterin-binding subunit [Intrasporangium mesophilum]
MGSIDISRRVMLTGTGAIVVGFSLGTALGVPAAEAQNTPGPGELRVDPTTHASSDDAWLILTAGRTTIYSARVELGTGTQTALTQIVVEELRLGMQRVDFVQGDTILTPSALTAGSKSIQDGGPLLRRAAATAYVALRHLAADYLGVPADDLTSEAGKFVVRGTNRSVSYERLLARANVLLTTSDTAPTLPPSEYRVVGTDVPRVDLPDKVFARFEYVADVTLPGMLHGRLIRPAGRNAQFAGITPESLARTQAIPGFVAVVQKGNFVGVVADNEYAATLAAAPATGLVVQWTAGPGLAPMASLEAELRKPENHYGTFVDVATGDFGAAYSGAARKLSATYFTPYQMHASMGASCAVADVRSEPDPETGVLATIWSGTQGVHNLRGAIATLLYGGNVDVTTVHVKYVEASGCYGHNGADDVAADAAVMSQAVGRPVRVQWTRQNEHGWEPLGEAAAHDLEAGVTDGKVVAWHHRLYALTANSRPGGNNPGTLLAGTLMGNLPADLPANSRNSSGRNEPVTYAIPNHLTDSKLVKSFATTGPTSRRASTPLTHTFLRTTALRSLGGFSNSFANESFLDEVAHAAGLDPLQVRLELLADDPRATAVLQAIADAWRSRPPGGDGDGAGLGFQQYERVEAYAAAYVEVTVGADGAVRVTRVVVAHDCGLIINPDGLRNQIEGNVIQGISRALREEVAFSPEGVTSVTWEGANGYAPIRFNDVPPIECILIDRPDQPAWGAGEPTIGTIGGAIGNAVYAATGRRVRRLPMTPARVLATPAD